MHTWSVASIATDVKKRGTWKGRLFCNIKQRFLQYKTNATFPGDQFTTCAQLFERQLALNPGLNFNPGFFVVFIKTTHLDNFLYFF